MSDSSDSSKIIKFIIYTIILILIVLIYFTLGGSVLYACKVVQSNILPTEENCKPFTSTEPNIESIFTNIFVTATDPPLSEKLKFPYEGANTKNLLLDMFREYKSGSKTNYLVNYIVALMEGLVSFDYLSLNTIFNFINFLPETLILFFGPIILLIVFIVLLIINCVYLIYLWFANMTWFFKINKNNDPNKPADWDTVTLWDPLLFSGRCMMMFVFIILFIILLIFAWGFLPLISVIFTIMTMFTYEAKDKDDKSTGLINILAKFFKFYKVTITSTICILVILSSFANLELTYALAVLVAAVMVFFGVVATTLFKEIHPTDITPLVSNNQANKTCEFKPKTSGGGFFGGTNITADIKKAGKKLVNLQD